MLFCLNNSYDKKKKIRVRKNDGSVITFRNQSERKITVIRNRYYDNGGSSEDISEHELDENSDVFFTLNVASNEKKFSLKVKTMLHSLLYSFYFNSNTYRIKIQAKYADQSKNSGSYHPVESTSETVCDNISLRAKVLTERLLTVYQVV